MGDSTDLNFSRHFQAIKDNEESQISDEFNTAVDHILYSRDVTGDSVDDLNKAFDNRDDKMILYHLHEYLAKDFLDVEKILKNHSKRRKIPVKAREDYSVKDINKIITLSDESSLADLHLLRGEKLQQAKQYTEAIKDYGNSLKTGLGKDSRYKAEHKLAQCQTKLGEYSAARQSILSCLQSLDSSNLSESNKKRFKKILEETLGKISNKEDREIHQKPVITVKEESSVKGISSCVSITNSPEKGRYAVAKSDIPPGEILALGPPAVFLLNPDDRQKMYEFCLNCLHNVVNIVPCTSCIHVVFCSISCRDQALSTFHKYECEIDLYGERQRGTEDAFNVFMTFKAIVREPLEFFQENFDERTLEYRGSDTLSSQFWNMVTHRDTRDEENLIKAFVITLLNLRILRLTTYCKREETSTGDSLSQTELFIGLLMLRIFMIQDMNSHPVFGLDSRGDKTQVGLENLGSGIYPRVGSYFNHACNPNTIRINVGRMQMLISSSRIKKGEEISDIYSMHYSEISREKRQSWLERNFNFTCRCQACEKDWNSFEKLPTAVTEDLRSKLQVVERGINQSLRSGDLRTTVDLHLRHAALLEDVDNPHSLHVLLRNSFQFACWRYYGGMDEDCVQ